MGNTKNCSCKIRWEVTMVRSPEDCPFWKYGCWVCVTQPPPTKTSHHHHPSRWVCQLAICLEADIERFSVKWKDFARGLYDGCFFIKMLFISGIFNCVFNCLFETTEKQIVYFYKYDKKIPLFM